VSLKSDKEAVDEEGGMKLDEKTHNISRHAQKSEGCFAKVALVLSPLRNPGGAFVD
jgi:hypothetical protein